MGPLDGQVYGPNQVTPVVATLAALRAATIASFGSGVWRMAYTTAGDSLPLFYVPGSGACSTDDGAGCVNSAGSNHWSAVFPSSGFDPRWWGIFPGGANQSTALQSMVNYVCTQNGGVIRFYPGSYNWHDINVGCPGIKFEGPETGSNGSPGSGVKIDCTGLSAFCLRYRATGSFPAAGQMDGAQVQNMTFTTSDRTGVILQFDQIRAPTVHRVAIWNALNGIRVYGSIYPNLSDIQGWSISGVYIELTGDSAARGDDAVIRNVGGGDQTPASPTLGNVGHTATGLWIHDQMFSVSTSMFQFEWGAYGYRVTCAGGAANLGSCPSNLLNSEMSIELSNKPVVLEDFAEFACDMCYMAGVDVTNVTNTFSSKLVNYSALPGAGGGVNISNSRISGAFNSCVYIGTEDSILTANKINQCNGAAGAFAAVEYESAVTNGGIDHTLTGNTLCFYLGASSTTSAGVLMGPNANRLSAVGNMMVACSPNIINNSNLPTTVYESNTVPPDGPPTVAAGSFGSGLGTGGTISLSAGTDFTGQILLTAGTGAVSSGSVTITFARPHYPGILCSGTLMRGANVWNSRAILTNVGIVNTTTAFEFDWDNNGVNLSAGGYFINYQCQKAA